MLPRSKDFFLQSAGLYTATVGVFALLGVSAFLVGLSSMPVWASTLWIQLLLAVMTLFLFLKYRWRSLFQWRQIDLLLSAGLVAIYGLVLWGLDRALAMMHPQAQIGDSVLPAMGSMFWISVIVAPIVEEFFFRDLLLRVLAAELRHFWMALLFSSAAFMIAHFSLYPGAFLLGLISGLLLAVTGSLWPSIIFHALSNATIYVIPACFPQLAHTLVRYELVEIFYR